MMRNELFSRRTVAGRLASFMVSRVRMESSANSPKVGVRLGESFSVSSSRFTFSRTMTLTASATVGTGLPSLSSRRTRLTTFCPVVGSGTAICAMTEPSEYSTIP